MPTTLTLREPQVRRNSLWLFAALQDELGELTTHVFGEAGELWPRGVMPPSVDIAETDGAVEVRMDLPGVKAEEIDIQLSDNFLTLTGHRKEQQEEQEIAYHCVERRQGTFARTIALPCCVNEAKVDAQNKDGVLKIVMPKTEESKFRKIKVRS